MSSESSSVQYMSTYIKGREMHSWTSFKITKASYRTSFLKKTAHKQPGSEMTLFPISSFTHLEIQAVLSSSLFAAFGMRPNFCSDNKNPLAWGLGNCLFPDRAQKQLSTGWEVRSSTWNSLSCYYKRFWVQNTKGTVLRRKYVLVDQ